MTALYWNNQLARGLLLVTGRKKKVLLVPNFHFFNKLAGLKKYYSHFTKEDGLWIQSWLAILTPESVSSLLNSAYLLIFFSIKICIFFSNKISSVLQKNPLFCYGILFIQCQARSFYLEKKSTSPIIYF